MVTPSQKDAQGLYGLMVTHQRHIAQMMKTIHGGKNAADGLVQNVFQMVTLLNWALSKE